MNTTTAPAWQQTCCAISSKLPGIIYRCGYDSSRTIEFINGNYLQLTGYDNLDRLDRIIHPAHLDRVLFAIDKGLQPGKHCSIEYPVITAQGEERWVMDQVAGVFDPYTHELVATEGILMDITERKLNEGQLMLYSSLLDQTNDPIFVINPLSGAFLAANIKASNSLGYTLEEILRLRVHDIEVAIPDEAAWKKHVEQVKEQRFIVLQGSHRRKDGSVFPAEVNVKYVEEYGNAYMIAIVRDISERLNAQRMLQKSDERFNLLSKASQDAIYDWSLSDNMIWWSEGLENITGPGIERENFDFNKWCDHLHPDDRPRVLESLNQAFFSKDTNWSCEYRFRGMNGKYRYIYDRGYMIYCDKNLHRMVGAMQDITERKHQEEKLRERIVYEHLVNGLCFDFINCKADEVDDLITDSLRAIGEFTKADRSYVFLFSADGSMLSNTHEWSRIDQQKDKWQNLPVSRLTWWMDSFSKFQAINVSSIDQLPPEALAYKDLLDERGIRSFLLLPMYSRGKLQGILGFDSVSERTWDENDLAMLNIISTVFTNAIVKRKNELALKDNERYLSQLIEGSPVGIFVKDTEGRFIMSNRVFADFLDCTPEDLQGRRDIDLDIPEELITQARGKDKRIFESQKPLPPYEVQITHPRTGQPLILELIKVPVKRGSTLQVLGIAMDITARKHTEEKLQREKDFSENLINTANVMIVGLDMEGRVLIFNKEAEKITGYTAEEIMGAPFFETIVPSVKFSYVWESFERFRGTKDIRTNDENPVLTKSGEERFISWRNMPLREGDKVIGSISFGIDITEKRIAEQKFKEQYVELEKINKELDKFVYSASHDLKAPLSSILGLVNVARMEELSESQAHYLDMIEKNISKLNGFILDIINYSRNSRVEPVVASIDPEALINETIEELQFITGFDNIKIMHEVSMNVPFYNDRARLKVVLNNLLSNAINYHLLTRPGPYIRITVEVDKKQAMLRVADNGQGIKKEYLPKVFDMFYRASDNSKGSGLGLYIVKEIVNKMKGSVSVESEPMKGSTFTVILPNLAGAALEAGA